jgi:two-component system, OmpR family, sensor histidine kinase KdpD
VLERAIDNGSVASPAEIPGTEEIAIESAEAESRRGRTSNSWREFGLAAFIVGIATLIALALRPYLAATNLAMVYLLGVVAVATRCNRRASVMASFLSVAAFDFFCVPPYLTFQVSEYEYLITFAGMLAVALVISAQTSRIRAQAARAVDRESRTKALYRLSRRLSAQTRVFDAALTAAEVAEEVFGSPVTIFLPEEGRISFRRRTSSQLLISTAEEEIAQAVFDHGRKAGKGMDRFPDAAATYLPLKGASRIVGVMAILPGPKDKSLLADQQHLLDLFANQTALAIERTLSQNAADEARMRMETEEMRSSLLSAVSHDLRTPLASITGAASTLRSQGAKLEPAVRDELLESISEEAMRLSRLVGNLLDMTRLESGVELRRDLYPLEEIVGAALQRLEPQVAGREVVVSLPDDLPLVYVDDVLLGQVLVNLIENATKYSPLGSAIEIAAEATPAAVELEIRDRGAGFAAGEEKRLFEKFYRGKSEGVGGAGLGLAICRAIVVAHRGSIEALHRPGGGAIFRIRLPLEARS